ncbi:hypothetical protein QQ045_025721 [Rhodiola kirilowii]
MSWRQMLLSQAVQRSAMPLVASGFCRFYSKSSPYLVKVGIPEFLSGIGKGVEAHVGKIETEIGDFQKLLATRTLKLKKLGIPCKQGKVCFYTVFGCSHMTNFRTCLRDSSQSRKLILKYSQKYRLGLWRPRAEPVKSKL